MKKESFNNNDEQVMLRKMMEEYCNSDIFQGVALDYYMKSGQNFTDFMKFLRDELWSRVKDKGKFIDDLLWMSLTIKVGLDDLLKEIFSLLKDMKEKQFCRNIAEEVVDFNTKYRHLEQEYLIKISGICGGDLWKEIFLEIVTETFRSSVKEIRDKAEEHGKEVDPEEAGRPIYFDKKIPCDSRNPEAILIADICESTRKMNIYGEEFKKQMKNKISDMAFPILKKYNQLFIKDIGDGFMATFDKAKEAVQSAVETLQAIKNFNQSKKRMRVPINIRFAINFGEVYIDENGDRQHREVTRTFRIEGLEEKDIRQKPEVTWEFPKKDYILISENVVKVFEDEGFNMPIKSLGLFELKDFPDLCNIYQIIVENEVNPLP